MIGLKQSPNKRNGKMRNNNRSNDSPTYNLSSNRLHDLHIVLIVKHSTADEGETKFIEDMDEVS